MLRGQAGGRAVAEKLGSSWMSEIGKKGFQAFTDRYFQGDRDQAGKWLRTRAHEAKLEGFVDRELERRLEQGQEVAAMEMPVLTGPDDEFADLPF